MHFYYQTTMLRPSLINALICLLVVVASATEQVDNDGLNLSQAKICINGLLEEFRHYQIPDALIQTVETLYKIYPKDSHYFHLKIEQSFHPMIRSIRGPPPSCNQVITRFIQARDVEGCSGAAYMNNQSIYMVASRDPVAKNILMAVEVCDILSRFGILNKPWINKRLS